MRFIIILFFSTLISNSILAQKELKSVNFNLKGNIIGRDTGYVYLRYNLVNHGVSDSFPLNKNGYFTFSGKIPYPLKVWLSISKNNNVSDSNSTEFYIEPCTAMRVQAYVGEFKHLRLTGSKTDLQRIELERKELPFTIKINNLLKPLAFYRKEYKGLNTEKDSIWFKIAKNNYDSINFLIDQYVKEVNKIDSLFIVQNPTSYIAADLLQLHVGMSRIKFQSLTDLYNKMPQKIKEPRAGTIILKKIEFNQNILIGSKIKNFIALDAKSDTINLAKYKGNKYVLLDFWGTWCKPCIEMIDDLKSVFDTYKNSLEIISIANENGTTTAWQKMIKQKDMQWIQVVEGKNISHIEPAKGTIYQMYHIDFFPGLILIDKNGVIIGRYNSSPTSFYMLLQDLQSKL